MQNSIFDTIELDKEKHVIFQELASYRDSPDDSVFENLVAGKTFIFKPLPEPDFEPKDEKSREFKDFILKFSNKILSAYSSLDVEIFKVLNSSLFIRLFNLPRDSVSPKKKFSFFNFSKYLNV